MYHLLNFVAETASGANSASTAKLYLTGRPEEIAAVLQRQLSFFGDLTQTDSALLHNMLRPCFQRLAKCFTKITNKAYLYDNIPLFNTLHSGQYCCFLAFLRDAVKTHPEGAALADKLYLLNKMLNGLDIYSATMPDYIFFEHPVGTVFGRAALGNYCLVNQKVTLGGTRSKADGGIAYPMLEDHVLLFSNAQIFGNATIGKFSVIAMNTTIVGEDIPPHSLVFGNSPKLTIKPLNLERFRQLSPFMIP